MTARLGALVMEDTVEVEENDQLSIEAKPIHQNFPQEKTNNKLFPDLGKPTQRGVKRCEKCGMLNGTRGIKCKNVSCDQVFKSPEGRKPHGPEAVKLHTDPSIQIYSVRTKTGDCRGFVQLPIVQDMEGNPAVVEVGIVCSAAKCYVETCGRSRNEALEPCFHIRSSVEALDEAKPLPIKKSALLGLRLPEEVTEQIWEFASDSHGPVVQKITKQIMAVRCLISIRHPLGYLHFKFLSSKKEEKRFVCSCREAKTVKVLMSENGSECTYKIQRCIHFYSCLAAFASDPALAKEFKFALDADNEEKSLNCIEQMTEGAVDLLSESDTAVETVTNELDSDIPAHLTTSRDNTLHDDESLEVIISSSSADSAATAAGRSNIGYSSIPDSHSLSLRAAKRFKPDTMMLSGSSQNLNHQTTSQSFTKWLNSVAERINLTMHFQLPGNPKPLVFYIPQVFWECLQQRISMCSPNKRRLPDYTTTVLRVDTPPLGAFTRFSWYLTELSHVRKVFDTAEVALLVSKYFDRCKDGSYKLSTTPRVQVETISDSYEPRIQNSKREYKTFLKVGPHGNQGTIPFVIDWIPDMFPITNTGELTLTFHYSHLVDGLAPAVQEELVKQVIEGTS